MQKKTVVALLTAFISVIIILLYLVFNITRFNITLFDRGGNTVSKWEAKHQIAVYLNEKYSTERFSPTHISIKKAMVGCGCDVDPLEFVGYTAKIKEIPDAPVSPKTVWMMIPEQGAPFFTDDGQLDEIHQSLEHYIETKQISSDYLLLPSEYGASFDYGDYFTPHEWKPGKGFHAYFDGKDLFSFFNLEYETRSTFSGQESDTYQYSVYFSIPGSGPEISYQKFYQDMEALKNSFHLSLDAVLMKESFFREFAANAASEENSDSVLRAFRLSPAVYYSAYQDGECNSPVFLPLLPGISLALNQETKTELTADDFQMEKTVTPAYIKEFFSKGSGGKTPDAALVDMLQTYTITCKRAEQSFEEVTLLIDLNALDFTYADAGILEVGRESPGISTKYYSDSLLFTNRAHTKFQIGSTLVMSTVLFPGNDSMSLTICPAPYLEEGTLWILP